MSDVQQEMDDILNGALPGEGEQPEAQPSGEAEAQAQESASAEAATEPAEGAATGEKEPAGSPPAEDVPSDSPEVSAMKAELARVREKNRALEADKAARDVLNQPPPPWMIPPQPQGQQVPQMPQAIPGQPQPVFQQPQAPQPAIPESFTLYDAEGREVQIANPDFAVRQAVQPLQAQIDAFQAQMVADQDRRIDASADAARAQYPDFDQALAGFQTAIVWNPSLVDQMRAHANPGEFAYRVGMAVAASAPPAPAGFPAQAVPQAQGTTQQPAAAAQAPPAPKLPGSLSDKAAPGGTRAAPPNTGDQLDRALPTHFG